MDKKFSHASLPCRIALPLLILLWVTPGLFAQLPRHAIGLRYGAAYGLSTDVSYQHGLKDNHRLEFDFGFNSDYEYVNTFKQDHDSWSLTGTYHWVYKLDKVDPNVNWYAGLGGKIGIWSSNQGYTSSYNNGGFVDAVGDVGIEYCFPAGIMFALNARPEIGLINHGTGVNIGFAVRYQFK